MTEFERYIFKRMALLTFWSLISATLLVLTTQVLIRLNILTSSGQTLVAFLKVAAFLVPNMITIVAPFAFLIGVSQVLNGMNSDSELVVMESAGASPMLIFRPILYLSLIVSALTFANANFLEARANRGLGDTLTAASADLLSVAVRKGSFQKLQDGLYIHIGELYPGGEYGNIFLSDRRAENQELIYFAERGKIMQVGEQRYMVLAAGQAQQRDNKNGNVSIVSFDSYALDLSSFIPTGERASLRPREQETLDLLFPAADDYYQQNFPQDITRNLLERLISWLYPVAFGLIAFVWLGRAQSNRQDQLENILFMIGTVLALRGFGFWSAEAAGLSNTVYVLAFAIPLATIAAFAIMAMTGHRPQEPKWYRQRKEHVYGVLQSQYHRAYRWYLGRLRENGSHDGRGAA